MDALNKRSFQVIVYQKDLWELINAMSKLFLYGNDDDNLRLNEWTKRAIQRHVLMECGPVAVSCFRLLESLGIQSRVVALREAGDKEGGHLLNEVFLEGQWVLIDFINKVFFVNADGCKISLFDVIENGGFENFTLVNFSKIHNFSNNSGRLSQISTDGVFYNSSFMLDFLRCENNLKIWFNGFKKFMISDDPVYKMYVLECEKFDGWADGYHNMISYDAFVAKFYKNHHLG